MQCARLCGLAHAGAGPRVALRRERWRRRPRRLDIANAAPNVHAARSKLKRALRFPSKPLGGPDCQQQRGLSVAPEGEREKTGEF